MLTSLTDIFYLGGVALVTALAALLPVGLASRYSIFSVDEEAPPWVSQTWSALHSFANGVFCTLTVQLGFKVSIAIGNQSATSSDHCRAAILCPLEHPIP